MAVMSCPVGTVFSEQIFRLIGKHYRTKLIITMV